MKKFATLKVKKMDSPRSIPALKAPASKVIRLVEIVHRWTGNRKAMDDAIVKYLRDVSGASRRNLIRAYAVPTLSHLGLIEGRGENLRCSPDGESLVNAAQQNDDAGLRRFGYLLHTLDSEKGFQVLSELVDMQADEQPVSRDDLGTRLWTKYRSQLAEQRLTSAMLADRLAKWLAYLEYVRFIDLLDADITLNPAQIEASLAANKVEVADELFRRLLFEGYEELKSHAMGSAYVPIPDVRRYVAGHLLEQGTPISEAQFDDLLRQQPRVTEEYVILLSPPGHRSDRGIWIGKDYFYYLSIHPLRRDK